MRIDNPVGQSSALTGSFSGSFIGDGTNLTGVGVDGLTATATAISASRHFVPESNNTYDLGSPTLVWRDLYLSSGSLYIDGTQVLSSNSTELRITTDANQSVRIIEEGVDTLTLQTENGDLTLTTTGTGNIELDAAIQITAGNNILSSDGNNITFTNGLTINDDTTIDADLTVTGNLQVTGTTTSVNSTDLEVTDKNILIASGALNAAAADQGGITVDGADATLLYISSGDQWQFNKKLDLGSNDFHAQDAEIDSLGIGTAASGTTGEIRATGDITAYYSSDERLKENFAPLTGALDKVKAIGGYEFDWKDGIEEVVSKTGHDIGVKAQELQAQYPELVHERDNGYLAVDYIKLNAVLIEAVKELAAKVDELSK